MTLSGTVGDWSKVIPYSAAGQAWGRKGAGGVRGRRRGLGVETGAWRAVASGTGQGTWDSRQRSASGRRRGRARAPSLRPPAPERGAAERQRAPAPSPHLSWASHAPSRLSSHVTDSVFPWRMLLGEVPVSHGENSGTLSLLPRDLRDPLPQLSTRPSQRMALRGTELPPQGPWSLSGPWWAGASLLAERSPSSPDRTQMCRQ